MHITKDLESWVYSWNKNRKRTSWRILQEFYVYIDKNCCKLSFIGCARRGTTLTVILVKIICTVGFHHADESRAGDEDDQLEGECKIRDPLPHTHVTCCNINTHRRSLVTEELKCAWCDAKSNSCTTPVVHISFNRLPDVPSFLLLYCNNSPLILSSHPHHLLVRLLQPLPARSKNAPLQLANSSTENIRAKSTYSTLILRFLVKPEHYCRLFTANVRSTQDLAFSVCAPGKPQRPNYSLLLPPKTSHTYPHFPYLSPYPKLPY